MSVLKTRNTPRGVGRIGLRLILSSKRNIREIVEATHEKSSESKLSLLDRVAAKLNGLDLKRILIISTQRLCSATEMLCNTLLQFQLDPQNLYVLGKCYSTNWAILTRLRKKNINVFLSSSVFHSHLSFDREFNVYADEMLEQVFIEKNLAAYEKIIIVDEEGCFLTKKLERFFSKDLPLVGIEQASLGCKKMKDANINFPIVNLATSWLKLEYETPLFIDSVLKKLKEKLSVLCNPIKKVLLIGYGILGQEIYKALKDDYSISIFDILPERSQLTPQDFKQSLSQFDLILGCTGMTSLTFEDFHYLKRPVILASLSYSDREFEAFKFRNLQPCKSCHDNVTFKGITLWNCGFPINFDEDHAALDTDDFQITGALILVSIYQALLTQPTIRGFIPLEHSLQHLILSELQQ